MVRVKGGQSDVAIFEGRACEDSLSDVGVTDVVLACTTKEDRRGLGREGTLRGYF